MKKLLLLFLIIGACISGCGRPSAGNRGSDTLDTSKPSDSQSEISKIDDSDNTVATTTKTAEETKPQSKEKDYTFLCCGDNIGHESVYTDAKNRSAGSVYEYNFLPMYDGIRTLLAEADLKFVNQETVTADASFGYHGYPNFNSPQDMGQTLVDLGFDVVNIASNHMLDMKAAGLASEINFWKTRRILMIGGYENQTDYDTPRVLEYQGLKIAFLSYTYGTNGMTLDTGSSLVVPLINETDIRRQVAKAKTAGDLVFVSMHWGEDSSLTVTSAQKKYADLLAELEVDVVIGHHSHTLQDMEWKTSASGHQTLIIYSLGNLLHSMYYDTAYTVNYSFMVGGIATFDIHVAEDGSLSIRNPVYHPTVCHYTKDPTGAFHAANFCVYELKDYTESLCAEHGAQVQHKFNLSDLYRYVKTQVSAEFLPAEYR